MGGQAPGDRLAPSALPDFLSRMGRRFRLEKAWLFGSRARGDHFLDSDVDLLLVSPDFEAMRFGERMTRMLECWDGDVPLEALCYTPDELARKRERIGIVREALREGVPLPLPSPATETVP